jgi:hypothetical protein
MTAAQGGLACLRSISDRYATVIPALFAAGFLGHTRLVLQLADRGAERRLRIT